MIARFFLVNLFLVPLFVLAQNSINSPAQILSRTHQAISAAKTLKYRGTVWERLKDGEYNIGETRLKVQTSPYKAYFYNLKPNTGAELLYDSEKNPGKALVNPNGFPWVSLNLNVHSNILRGEMHHSVLHAGMAYFDSIIRYAEKSVQAKGKYEEYFLYKGVVAFKGIPCHLVEIHDPEFSILEYTVQKGENVVSIAANKCLSEYKILELNPKVKNMHDVKAGQVIKVPSSYSKKTYLHLDHETFLPVNIEIYDEKGKFEQYGYFELQVNPLFNSDEFTENYKDYGF